MVDNVIWFGLGAVFASTIWYLLSVRADNVTQRRTPERQALDDAFRRAQQ